MTIGYKLSPRCSRPRSWSPRPSEAAGFNIVEISDYYHPWLFSHDFSGFAWSVLGAIAARTERIELAIGVTRPFLRYHPAIVVQAAATTAVAGRPSRQPRAAARGPGDHPAAVVGQLPVV